MLDAVKNMMATDSALLSAVPEASTATQSSSFDMAQYAEADNDPVRGVDAHKDNSSDDYGQGWQTASDDDVDIDTDGFDEAELASAAGESASQPQTEQSEASGGASAQQTQNQSAEQTAAQAQGQAADTQANTTLLEELAGRGKWVQSDVQAASQSQQVGVEQVAATGETAEAVAVATEETIAKNQQSQQGSLDITDSGEMADVDMDDLAALAATEDDGEAAQQSQSQSDLAAGMAALSADKKNAQKTSSQTQSDSSGDAFANADTLQESSFASGGSSNAAATLTDNTSSQSQLIDFTPETSRSTSVQSAAANNNAAAQATAAEAQAEAEVDTQLDIDRLGSRVVQWRNLGLLGNGGSARIRLTPPEMGSVDVSLRTDGQTVQISMTVESESVRQVLQGNSQRLVESLQSSGLQAGRIEVTVNTPQSESGQDANSQGNQQGGQNTGQDSGNGNSDSSSQQNSQGDSQRGDSGQYYSDEELDISM